jgi:hypothetical protein
VIVMTAPVNELEDEIAHLRDLDLPGLRAAPSGRHALVVST